MSDTQRTSKELFINRIERHMRVNSKGSEWLITEPAHLLTMNLLNGAFLLLKGRLASAPPPVKPPHEREPPHCSTCGCGLSHEPLPVPMGGQNFVHVNPAPDAAAPTAATGQFGFAEVGANLTSSGRQCDCRPLPIHTQQCASQKRRTSSKGNPCWCGDGTDGKCTSLACVESWPYRDSSETKRAD